MFLWKDAEGCQQVVEDRERKARLEEEIADVQIFLLYLSKATGISIPEAVRRKLEINAGKYPVEEARGSAVKYSDRQGPAKRP